MNQMYDIIIIGSGPGGYVAGIRAAQLGLKTLILEKAKPGGVCLNIGCIPTKSLIHDAHDFSHLKNWENYGLKIDLNELKYQGIFSNSRKVADKLSSGISYLLKKNKIDYIQAQAHLTDKNTVTTTDGQQFKGKSIIVATGSSPRVINGFEFDGKQILSSDDALMLEKLPKSMIIMGTGAIGLEFAYIFACFGVKIQIIELMEQILPTADEDLTQVLRKSMQDLGVEFFTSTQALSVKKSASSVQLTVEQKGQQKTLKAEKLLVAVGRTPNTQNLNLEKIGIQLNKGYIVTKDHYQTHVEGIYAIGDVEGSSPLLAHVASKQGEIVAEHIKGLPTELRLAWDEIPAIVYSVPNIASFGYSEKQAKEEKKAYRVYRFPFSAIGMALASRASEGFVKILYEEKTHEILGAHIVGINAAELIHELLLAKKTELLPEDIATLVHGHPTTSEAIMEASRGVEGWAIHI